MMSNSCNCPSFTSTGPTLASTCGGASFVIFMSLLESFLRNQCDLEDPCNRPISQDYAESSYDFIVIGSGSAGATVAGRLTENDRYSVLLLEAGVDAPTATQVPSLFFNFIGSDIDWHYSTEPEEAACLNNNGICTWPRGKVFGGTGVMNGMMYMRGSQKDYDDWASLGNSGWSWNDVLPFFIRSENNLQLREMDYGYHGTGGPLTVTHFPYYPPFGDSIIDAGKELGYHNVDLNGKNHTGFAIAQTTSRHGSRLSSARAFLHPATHRSNLHVILNATVTRIIFDKNKLAVAVEFIRNDELQRVAILKEVIISGGAVNSPQILLNSGIGPKEDLAAVGVPTIHHLPGVGENLHNHIAHSVPFTINETNTRPLDWATATRYLLNRNGLMSGTGLSQVTAMINTKFANVTQDHPDIQLFFGGYLANCATTGIVGESLGNRRTVTISATLLHPKSRGYLRLRDNNPLSKPKLYPKSFNEPDDARRLVEGIKFALQLANTTALSKYDMKLITSPVSGCENFTFATDDYWMCAIKWNTGTENHQAGTCKMGPADDPMAVVDNELRVRGVVGVRVADTSIMPRVTSGNTNAPAIMIGERAADFLRKTYG